MLYTGQFKTNQGHTIQVNITTSSGSGETELTFAGESPVIINQSSDGIFSPIKSRSCTITIVSKAPYYDMYSGTSHGTSVEVLDLTDAKCIFYGYLTPAEYSQPLLYLNEIELEAVDALSTLQDYKYTYTKNNAENIVCIKDILIKLYRKAGYKNTGTIYSTYYIKKATDNKSDGPFEEYINDDIFFSDDDDHEGDSCYEVLEEICNFYGLTAVPMGYSVFLVDYEVLTGADVMASYTNQVRYYDLINGDTVIDDGSGYVQTAFDGTITGSGYIGTSVPLYTKKSVSIDINSYLGDDQTVSMEEVYNKVSFKADIRKVDEDSLKVDIEEDGMNSATYWKAYTDGSTYGDKNIFTRFYTTNLFSNYFGDGVNNKNWQNYYAQNCEFTTATMSYKLTPKFNNVSTDRTDMVYFPYTAGYIMNHINAQCALPTQLFSYGSGEGVPYKSDWSNYISFFTQIYWSYKYWINNETDWFDLFGNKTKNEAANIFYSDYFGGNNVLLKYVGDKVISYSPPSGFTSYLCFDAKLWYQKNFIDDNTSYPMWKIQNNYVFGVYYPLCDLGINKPKTAGERGTGDGSYNKGWNCLRLRIKIGDKYWNGSYWTRTPSNFWVSYHDSEVNGNTETISWNKWLKPCTSYDYTWKVGKDCLAIPIEESDGLYGNVEVSFYMPMPLGLGNAMFSGDAMYDGIAEFYPMYTQVPPVIFMKDLSLEVVTTDKSTLWYTYDIKKISKETLKEVEDDEVTYTTTINGDFVKEMDDIDLKINTWHENHRLAKSYILAPDPDDLDNIRYVTNGFYDRITKTTKTQELHLVDLYTNHYRTPKKIYECQVRGYYQPMKYVNVSGFDGSKFIVDEQDYDVKSGQNTLKLIEY